MPDGPACRCFLVSGLNEFLLVHSLLLAVSRKNLSLAAQVLRVIHLHSGSLAKFGECKAMAITQTFHS